MPKPSWLRPRLIAPVGEMLNPEPAIDARIINVRTQHIVVLRRREPTFSFPPSRLQSADKAPRISAFTIRLVARLKARRLQ